MKSCRNCGKALSDEDRFCSKCGTKSLTEIEELQEQIKKLQTKVEYLEGERQHKEIVAETRQALPEIKRVIGDSREKAIRETAELHKKGVPLSTAYKHLTGHKMGRSIKEKVLEYLEKGKVTLYKKHTRYGHKRQGKYNYDEILPKMYELMSHSKKYNTVTAAFKKITHAPSANSTQVVKFNEWLKKNNLPHPNHRDQYSKQRERFTAMAKDAAEYKKQGMSNSEALKKANEVYMMRKKSLAEDPQVKSIMDKYNVTAEIAKVMLTSPTLPQDKILAREFPHLAGVTQQELFISILQHCIRQKDLCRFQFHIEGRICGIESRQEWDVFKEDFLIKSKEISDYFGVDNHWEISEDEIRYTGQSK